MITTFEKADYDEIYEFAYKHRWTDGLPIVPPTPARVERMLMRVLDGHMSPEDEVSSLGPRGGSATFERIAINAVMAGCKPEYMPILVAATKIMGESDFNLAALQATTSPAALALIVNGPIRATVGINCSTGCLGPGSRANATIGRAIRLMLINIGGGLVGDVDKSTHGSPLKFSLCFGEDEEASPWNSLHTDAGYINSQSTVTMTGVVSLIENRTGGPRAETAIDSIRVIAAAMAHVGSKGFQLGRGTPIFILPTGLARIVAEGGYDKEELRFELWRQSAVPESRLPQHAMTHYSVKDGYAYACESWESVVVIVAGGPEANQSMFMSSFVDVPLRTELILE